MDYSLDDWMDDWNWYHSLIERLLARGASKGSQNVPFRDYFSQKYQHDSSVSYHRERMAAALSYADRHIRELDVSPIAVVGDTTALTTKAFALALWRMYAQCPDAELSTDFPTDIVIQFANENQTILDQRK